MVEKKVSTWMEEWVPLLERGEKLAPEMMGNMANRVRALEAGAGGGGGASGAGHRARGRAKVPEVRCQPGEAGRCDGGAAAGPAGRLWQSHSWPLWP